MITLKELKETLVVLIILVILGFITFGLELLNSSPTEPIDGSETASTTIGAIRGPILNEAAPTHLRIPKIGVDTSIVELGLNANQEIEVPDGFEEVGWYKYGPTPGELGPAVILGHVDSYSGPAVFYSLGQLDPGDKVEIDRGDGTTAVFEVKSLERYERDNFPTTLVYGDINHAGLRLITCSGSYDRNEKHYDHNLVVYAELIEETEK